MSEEPSLLRRSRIALLIGLGVDNFGSGLFLPFSLVYPTRVVGLPLATAGVVVSVVLVVGLLVPPVVGPVVDRVVRGAFFGLGALVAGGLIALRVRPGTALRSLRTR
ncbi:MAG: hypothetical protein ACR2KG_02255 [Nocardioidaceae bacterium]